MNKGPYFILKTDLLHRTNPEENHGDNDEEQVERLALYVLLLEDEPAGNEAYYHARTTYEADDRDKRTREGQGIEIAEVGNGKEDRDTDDLPFPMEGMLPAMSFGSP